ncbi:MAG: ChbG/HpnK family deacetylase [Deltaproteobacteria bacterium]|nr:ChbG/HpnK family deacetylase [Deltaproteobacteria bacterium]
MKTIIHCDDLGTTRQMTLRILDCWRKGYLDGFSIIANGDALSEVFFGLKESSDREARIAVHLNLTEGRAILKAEDLSLIADSEGNLKCSFGRLLINGVLYTKRKKIELIRQIEKEWSAQMETVVNTVRPRSVIAIDGHTHIHMIPFLFPIAAKLAVEQGIPEIRISNEPFYLSKEPKDSSSLNFGINIIKHLVLKLCVKKAKKVAYLKGLKSADAFIGILYTGRMTATAAIAGIKAANKKHVQSVEVLFHIGRASHEEAVRWGKSPREGKFPLSEARDTEYGELIKFCKKWI